MRVERITDRLGRPVEIGDEVWDLGGPQERQQNKLKHGTLYVRKLPVVDVFDWGLRLRKANGDEIDSTFFERVVERKAP